MSLFPSAFDGPSSSRTSTIAVPNAGKRKRTSLGKDDQLRATQANLAKLMDKVERGDVKEKSGTENLGHVQKKKKEAKGEGKGYSEAVKKGKGSAAPKGNERVPAPEQKGKPAQRDTPKPQAKAQPKETPKAKAKPKANDTPKKLPKANEPKAKGKPSPSSSKPAPFQLPTPVVETVDDSNLTDMQRQMRTKLEGARFRWINEQLYSTPSTEAVAMMKKDPKIFADYHAAHRSQTAAWPSPPLPHIQKLLAPLKKGTVIADLGCGDAGLARALVPKGKVVLSYDLVGDGEGAVGEGWVVRADFLTHVPLPGRPGGSAVAKKAASEIVDVVVCCLSLMGTNWVGGIYEAARILKQGGTFHVAEVTSRFVSTEAFVEAVTSFGFVLDNQEEPSTHFTLFKFTKQTPVPAGPARGEEGWEERVRAGEEILRACVYKKR